MHHKEDPVQSPKEKNTDLFFYGSGGQRSRVSFTELKSRCQPVWFLLKICVFMLNDQVIFNSLWPHGLATSLLCPWDFPGKNTRVGCHFLLQESSRSRDQTCISRLSCIVDKFFIAEPPFWKHWGENQFLCLFQVLVAVGILWFVALSSVFKVHTSLSILFPLSHDLFWASLLHRHLVIVFKT